MKVLTWSPDLDTGVAVIDQQHRRIVDLINALNEASKSNRRDLVEEAIGELIDYTMSHFAFEEELLDESGYHFGTAHRRVHEMFTRRVNEYKMRFDAGEDVTDELRTMLSRWLFNHIRTDDKAYSDTVKRYLDHFSRAHQGGGWMQRTLNRLFG